MTWTVQNLPQPDQAAPLAVMGLQIAWLIENAYSFSIEANDDRGSYQTVADFVDSMRSMHGEDFIDSWTDEADMQRCVDANFMICVRCYPSTSVGSFACYGSNVVDVVARIYGAVRSDLDARPNEWRAHQDSNLKPLA